MRYLAIDSLERLKLSMLFSMVFISLNIFVYLLFSPAIGFVAFSCFSSLSYRLFGSSMSVAYI